MSLTDEVQSEAVRPAPRRSRLRRLFGNRVFQVVAVLVAALLLWAAVSIGVVLTKPGNDSTSARLAEWARDHHLGGLVTLAEKAQYSADKPKAGGTPAGGIPLQQGEQPTATKAPVPTSPAPANLKPLANGAPLANEGVWQDVVTNKGVPAVRITYLRPDDQYTSFLAAVMWLDPKLLSMRLHPGYQDPGGTWSTPDSLTPALRQTVAASFPGGFRLNGASRGGYYDQGREALPLRTGAASVVIYKDGSVKIGQWGRDVQSGPNVKSVRQNLDLLVDNGQVNPTCSDNNTPTWGYTLGNSSYVPRTAIGQRADGSIVFINSPATTVCSLGRLLQTAGAARGMELDINPEWSIGFYYTHNGQTVTPHRSRPDQSKSDSHYFAEQSRDFLAFYLRP